MSTLVETADSKQAIRVRGHEDVRRQVKMVVLFGLAAVAALVVVLASPALRNVFGL